MTKSLIACLAVLFTIAAQGAENPQPPTFRDTAEWIIFSGVNDEAEALELWTYAIKKTAVRSVRIEAVGARSDEGSPEKMKTLPAAIWITTTEIAAEGGNKDYKIGGLTHAAASAMLDEILEAIEATETTKAGEIETEGPLALRILPVGEAPPWEEIEIERDDGKGKARLQQEPASGSVPPRQVSVVSKEEVEEGDPATLTLNQFSAVMEVPGRTVGLHESNPGGVKSKPWHFVAFPPGASTALAIIWRDPEVKTWDKAKSLTLPDDLTAFPAGTVRIVNVCGVEVNLNLDGRISGLPHGEALLHPAEGGKTHLKVTLEWGGKRTVIADQRINQDAKERAHVIIHLADGNAPRRPAKALVLREVARTPTAPVKQSP